MKISAVRKREGRLTLAKESDVDIAQSVLGIRFPLGYREYVTTLGSGFMSDLVRIYLPNFILDTLSEWRGQIVENWYWGEDSNSALKRSKAAESVILGVTSSGDQLVIHPSAPDRILVLPYDYEEVFFAGNDLFSAIDWMCSSGKFGLASSERVFLPRNALGGPP